MTGSDSCQGTSLSEIFTKHPRTPIVLSLAPFVDGFISANTDPKRCGFRGRPELIAQLTPVLRECIQRSSPVTAMHWGQTLRTWWRFFDRAEGSSPGGALRIETIIDLSDHLGQLAAKDPHLNRHTLLAFRELASDACEEAGLPRLNWKGLSTTYRVASSSPRSERRRPAE